jgi:hypothetical protein
MLFYTFLFSIFRAGKQQTHSLTKIHFIIALSKRGRIARRGDGLIEAGEDVTLEEASLKDGREERKKDRKSGRIQRC